MTPSAARLAAPALAGVALVAVLALEGTALATPPPGRLPSGATAPPRPAPAPAGTTLPGTHCPVFPADNIWNTPVTGLPVDARSAQWLAHTGATSGTRLHPDFGPSYGAQPVPYGIGYTLVTNATPRVPVTFTYASESDRVAYPLGPATFIEGGWGSTGDRHAIEVNTQTCTLYETWDTREVDGHWTAGSGATWNLRSNALRPAGWTSADAAGLPILPGLVSYDEVLSGHINHALRMTVEETSQAYVWPARHEAGSTTDPAYPPMGARFRLKASFSLAGYSAQARVVLTAMKTYGLIVADNGSNWYFQGTADSRWPDSLISALKTIPASAFEAVDTSRLQVSPNSGQAR